MDRRTLLAVILATLVLVGFQLLFPQQPAPRPANPTGSAPTGSGSPAEIATATPSRSESGGSGQTAAGADASAGLGTRGFSNVLVPADSLGAPIVISTAEYSAQLSADGGILREWRLAKYTDAKEQPAELVAHQRRGLFRLAVVGPTTREELSEIAYAVESDGSADGSASVLVAQDSAGRSVRLSYLFPRGQYEAQLKVELRGFDNHGADQSLELSFPDGLPTVEKIPNQDKMASAALALIGKDVSKHFSGHAGMMGCGGSLDPFETSHTGVVHWIATESKYFLAAALPEGAPDATTIFRRTTKGGPVGVAVRLPLALDGPTVRSFRIYAGPMEYSRLETYAAGLERAVDLGYRLFRPLTQLLLKFFQFVYTFIPNYGMVIIVLSVLLKVLFYPLTKKSLESMAQLQRLKPEIDRLTEKYKDDAQRRNQAMFELYRKHKVNPMGGCLPLLLQMPVFIGLYSVFNSSIELRKAPFLLWITDLSAPDKVGAILGTPIHILPILMAGTSILQAKLTPSTPNQAGMTYLMPLITTMIFYGLPSGLVLYWTVTNIIQIGQQILANRSVPKTLAAA